MKEKKERKEERERVCDPYNTDPQQVMKVNPNPKCKHQITLLHNRYRINTCSFIGLPLY